MPSIADMGCLQAAPAGVHKSGDCACSLAFLAHSALAANAPGSLSAGWACTLHAYLPARNVPEKLLTLPVPLLQHDSYLKAIARALHRGNSESQFAAVVVIKYLVAHSASTHYVLAQVSHLSLDGACLHHATDMHRGCS